MDTEIVKHLLSEGEGQNVEFKESLAEEQDAVQTLVAFANSLGGRVFFGVTNDGKPRGITIGKNTLENLANNIKGHTYPTLPASVDQVILNNGEDKASSVIVVEVTGDVPPLTGAYLYSSEPINPSVRVVTAKLQAFRRVGRVTQQEDFMRMRPERPASPLVELALEGQGQTRGQFFPTNFGGVIWLDEGSRSIQDLRFSLEPSVGRCAFRLPNVPLSDMRRRFTFAFECQVSQTPKGDIWLVATYFDDTELEWETRRRLEIEVGDGVTPVGLRDSAPLVRRIVSLPAQRR